MRTDNWREKIVPILMLLGVASLLLTLLLGGFILYQWVLAFEATAASLILLLYYVRYYSYDSRKSRWPPLLPLSIIAASGGAKSFYVATGSDTPFVVVAILLASVGWFIIKSWQLWKAERRSTLG